MGARPDQHAPAAIAASTRRRDRLALAYLLDLIAVARRPGELLEPLILGAITSANLSRLRDDPVLDGAFAALGASPPDSLRRALPVHALAASLDLPYETVRRRVHHLAAAGRCKLTPDGAICPASADDDSQSRKEAARRHDRTRRFYFDLLGAGEIIPVHVRDGSVQHLAEAPAGLVSRVAEEYALGLTDAMLRRTGDPVKAMILMETARAARPLLTAELSRRLQIPAETVRRHGAALGELGWVVRGPSGFSVSPDGLRRSGLEALARENSTNLRRLFVRLDRTGVLHRWDLEAGALKACA